MAYKISRIIFAVMFSAMLFSLAVNNAVGGFDSMKTVFAEFDMNGPLGIKGEIAKIEASISENMVWRFNFIEGYAYFNTLIGSNTSEMDLGRGKEGGLYNITLYPDDQIDAVRNYARRIHEMQNYTAGKGTKVLYVQPPEQNIKDYTEAPYGLPLRDRSTRLDALLYHLKGFGADYLDLRLTLPRHHVPLDKWFYKTDHHWTGELAFAAFVDIVTYLDDHYEANLDPDGFYRDASNYGTVTYPNSFLGSSGRKTGIIFSQLDDFTAIYPKFDTRYHLKKYNIDHDGGALETVYAPSWLATDRIYKNIPYGYYLEGVSPYHLIENLDNEDAPTLLLVGDSYSMPIMSFLSPMFSRLEFVWPLADSNAEDTFMGLLENNTYDYIVVESYSDNISDDMFCFFRYTDVDAPIGTFE